MAVEVEVTRVVAPAGVTVAAMAVAVAEEATAMVMVMKVAARSQMPVGAKAEAIMAAVTAPIGMPAVLLRTMNISPGAVTRPSISPGIPARATDPPSQKRGAEPPAS